MSRLVPACPVFGTVAEEQCIGSLEAGLDDEWVVFQKVANDGYLCVHPEKGICQVVVVTGAPRWDAGLGRWIGLDLEMAAETYRQSLPVDLGVPIAVVAYIPGVEGPSPDGDRRLVFSTSTASLPLAISETLDPPLGIGERAADSLLRALSPGESPYRRGYISPQQEAWRDGATTSAALTPSADNARPTRQQSSGREATMPGTPLRSDDGLIRLMRQVVTNVSHGAPIYVGGVRVSVDEVVAPDFLLPALLVSAAEDWTPAVMASGGRGGFTIRLRSDPAAVFGFRVEAIEPASVFIALMTIADRIRRGRKQDDEVVLDADAAQFARFLSSSRINLDMIGEVEVRVALRAIEG